jgi:hypothetical protein
MRAKYVHEVLKEGYGAGFSFTGGNSGTFSRSSGFGGANNLGGQNSMYTYEIKSLSHTLEQLPTATASQIPQIQVGSRISGNAVRTNATPLKKEITGIVRKIETSNNGALKYYLVQDEATQNYVKIEPLTVKLLIAEPVQYHYDSTDSIPTKKKGRKINVA